MKLFEAIIDEEQAHFNYFDSVAATSRSSAPLLGANCGHPVSHRSCDAGVSWLGKAARNSPSMGRTN